MQQYHETHSIYILQLANTLFTNLLIVLCRRRDSLQPSAVTPGRGGPSAHASPAPMHGHMPTALLINNRSCTGSCRARQAPYTNKHSTNTCKYWTRYIKAQGSRICTGKAGAGSRHGLKENHPQKDVEASHQTDTWRPHVTAPAHSGTASRPSQHQTALLLLTWLLLLLLPWLLPHWWRAGCRLLRPPPPLRRPPRRYAQSWRTRTAGCCTPQ